MKYVINFEQLKISENLQYHIDKDISVFENIFRSGSDSFYELLKESRELFDKKAIQICEEDIILFEETDLGYFDYYEGHLVPLDLPFIEEINEAEYHGKEVKLGHPTRSSGPKKYQVYVKNPKTDKVIKVSFGDKKGGLRARTGNAKAKANFSKRMECGTKHKDRTKPGYWSCRLNRYKNLSGSGKTGGYW
jgi:hypothetical protein